MEPNSCLNCGLANVLQIKPFTVHPLSALARYECLRSGVNCTVARNFAVVPGVSCDAQFSGWVPREEKT